jgi:CBS domain-containing protein
MARALLLATPMSLERFRTAVATIDADDTVVKAAQRMRDGRVGSLVVARRGRPIGIVTDRDIVVRAIAEQRDPAHDRIGNYVTYDPVTVYVYEGIETASERMRRYGVRRLPIVDADGMAIGIVTADDLLVLLGGEMAAVCEGIEHAADADDSR